MKSYLKFFVFLAIIALCSCVPRLEDNVRILVKGNIEDHNGSPIQSARIAVYSNTEYYYESSESLFLLGEGISDSDGVFSVVSFLDTDDDFSIVLNNGEGYSEYLYQTSTLNYTPEDLTFDLGTVTISKLANVTVNVNRISPQGTTLSYDIVYPSIYCREYYYEGVLDEIQSYCYEENYTYGSLNDDNPDGSKSLQTLMGSILEFTYSINGQQEETELLTIDQENYEFNFTY